MSRKQKAIFASLSVVVNFVVLAVTQFTITPLIIRLAGNETLGQFSILLQILGYLAILDLGFTAAFQRFLARSYGIEQKSITDGILRDSRIWFVLVDLVRAASGVLLINILGMFGSEAETFAVLQNLFWYVSGWYVVRGWLTLYSPALVALQNIATTNYLTMLSSVGRLVISIIFLTLGFGLEGLVWGIILSEVILNLGCLWAFSRRYGRIRFEPVAFSWIEQKKIIGFGLKSVPIGFASVTRQQSDVLIVGLILGAVPASILYTTKMPVILALNLIFTIVSTVAPVLDQFHSKEEKNKLGTAFCNLHRYGFTMSFALCFGLILFHEGFTKMWVGEEQYGGIEATLAFAFYVLVIASTNVNGQFAFSRGNISVYSKICAIEAILTLVMIYVFAEQFGLIGAIFASALCCAITCSYLWWITIPTYTTSIGRFVIDAILSPFSATCIATLLTLVTLKSLGISNLLGQMLIFVMFVGVVAYRFILTENDRSSVNAISRKTWSACSKFFRFR